MTYASNGMDRLAADLQALAVPFGPPVLPKTDISYRVYRTGAIGTLLLAADQDGALLSSVFLRKAGDESLVLNKLARRISPRILRREDALDDAISQLAEYLRGDRRSFDLRFNLEMASEFQRAVLDDVRARAGYGAITTYSEVANHIQRPKAQRAVGTALGTNPLCVFIPCHRVVGSRRTLSGYAGGLEAKQTLLELEGIDLDQATLA